MKSAETRQERKLKKTLVLQHKRVKERLEDYSTNVG